MRIISQIRIANKRIPNKNKSNLKRINFSNANKYTWQYE